MCVCVSVCGGRGGLNHFFSLTLYHFHKSGGLKALPQPLPLRGLCSLIVGEGLNWLEELFVYRKSLINIR